MKYVQTCTYRTKRPFTRWIGSQACLTWPVGRASTAPAQQVTRGCVCSLLHFPAQVSTDESLSPLSLLLLSATPFLAVRHQLCSHTKVAVLGRRLNQAQSLTCTLYCRSRRLLSVLGDRHLLCHGARVLPCPRGDRRCHADGSGEGSQEGARGFLVYSKCFLEGLRCNSKSSCV